jgi:isoaspartyl peptidase/L-asparaginase-like protein (Ntn-hydrolase superfamily)
MKWAVISTWEMSKEGLKKASVILARGGRAEEAVLAGVQDVESNPQFHSVGYGGFPDRTGHVTMDAGFMDGDTMQFGAVCALEGFASAAEVACSLKGREFNNVLAGRGADEYARELGFRKQNNLTAEALSLMDQEDSHDTVCFVALDQMGTICVCTSTSGLKGKEPGRVGDTPMPGCGYYAVSEIGGAAATGVGEDICKGVLSYQAVQLMKRRSVKEAAEQAVDELVNLLQVKGQAARDMSLIALDREGSFGIGTNVIFPFCYASSEDEPALYEAESIQETVVIRRKGRV